MEQAEKGLIDVDLGGGVIKQRIAREGQGKSHGYRSIILYRTKNHAFFVYGFAKNDLDNIDDNDVLLFKKAAPHVLNLTDKQLKMLINTGQFTEVSND